MMLKQITTWMHDAGQTTDTMNRDQVALYLGLCCEELNEALDSQDLDLEILNAVSYELRQGDHVCTPNTLLVDAACDLIWVSVGLLASMGVDPEEAMQRVLDSNNSKRNPDGTMTVDFTGKVVKPAGYREPDFSGLLDA